MTTPIDIFVGDVILGEMSTGRRSRPPARRRAPLVASVIDSVTFF
jgi:hypothetical protein